MTIQAASTPEDLLAALDAQLVEATRRSLSRAELIRLVRMQSLLADLRVLLAPPAPPPSPS